MTALAITPKDVFVKRLKGDKSEDISTTELTIRVIVLIGGMLGSPWIMYYTLDFLLG